LASGVLTRRSPFVPRVTAPTDGVSPDPRRMT
jgi:hypothetical protein